jgi:DNA polymerase-4
VTAPAARICCLDLDTFFVSVERVLDPSLEGKPVVVGGLPGQRGVVTAASYEVRKLGVHSAMPLATAYRLAPHAIYLPTRHGIYGEYSERVRAVVERFCPVVQTASIDEYFLDFTGCERMYRREVDRTDDEAIHGAVARMAAAIKSELGLPASAGIATSKPVCKIASGLAKPAGIILVPRGKEAEFLAPLPVRKFPGIGPAAERRLAARGIETLGQIARLSPEELERMFGKWGAYLQRGANGEGSHDLSLDRPAFWEHDPSGAVGGSISNERTFREDVTDERTVLRMLCALTERVCWRARRRGVLARTITLKLRYRDFETISRSKTIAPTDSELELYPIVKAIYRRARTRDTAIRLLGLQLSNLGFFDERLPLFADERQRQQHVHQAVDAIRAKYGFDAVHLARAQRRGPASRSRARPRSAFFGGSRAERRDIQISESRESEVAKSSDPLEVSIRREQETLVSDGGRGDLAIGRRSGDTLPGTPPVQAGGVNVVGSLELQERKGLQRKDDLPKGGLAAERLKHLL